MIARCQRLLTWEDFERVHAQADWRYKATGCATSARRNQLRKARLGLIAAKKSLPLAVSRNRFKRLAREVFREHQQKLRGLDVIFTARSDAGDMRAYELRASLEQLVAKLTACAGL